MPEKEIKLIECFGLIISYKIKGRIITSPGTFPQTSITPSSSSSFSELSFLAIFQCLEECPKRVVKQFYGSAEGGTVRVQVATRLFAGSAKAAGARL